MSLSRIKNWIAEVLQPSDLNAEFNNILNYINASPYDLPAGQIKFPSTQLQSSNANTLDDYEEGTFTISLIPTTGSITLSGSFNTGYYTKVGRNVTVYGLASVTSVSSPTGTLSIRFMPFAAQNVAPYGQCMNIICNALTGAAQPGGIMVSNSLTIECNDYATGTAGNLANLVATSTVVYFHGTYPAAT